MVLEIHSGDLHPRRTLLGPCRGFLQMQSFSGWLAVPWLQSAPLCMLWNLTLDGGRLSLELEHRKVCFKMSVQNILAFSLCINPVWTFIWDNLLCILEPRYIFCLPSVNPASFTVGGTRGRKPKTEPLLCGPLYKTKSPRLGIQSKLNHVKWSLYGSVEVIRNWRLVKFFTWVKEKEG